jgi:hypothetical protein
MVFVRTHLNKILYLTIFAVYNHDSLFSIIGIVHLSQLHLTVALFRHAFYHYTLTTDHDT